MLHYINNEFSSMVQIRLCSSSEGLKNSSKMSMFYPKLYADSNRCARVITRKCLEKYHDLIKWREHPSILEIGHGDGGTSRESLFPYLPKDMKEFVATDISEQMVEYARKNTTHPLVEVAQLDVTTVQIPSEYTNRFDNIFGFFVMHLVKPPTQALINMHKMLKPGGSIFLSIFEHAPVDDVLDQLRKNPEWKKFGLEKMISPFYYAPNPRLEWERELKHAGFQNYEFIEEIYSYEFLDDREFDGLLLSICSFLPNIPDFKLDEFKEVFRKKTRQGKLMRSEVLDGKEILSYHNFKMFITYASKD